MGSLFPDRQKPAQLDVVGESECIAWSPFISGGMMTTDRGEMHSVFPPHGQIRVSVPYWRQLKSSKVVLTIEPTIVYMDRQMSNLRAELQQALTATSTEQQAAGDIKEQHDEHDEEEDAHDREWTAFDSAGKYIGVYADPDEGWDGYLKAYSSFSKGFSSIL